MESRYRSSAANAQYFAGDRSGVTLYCRHSGDTHFLRIDSAVMKALSGLPAFSLGHLCDSLGVSPAEGCELIETLSDLGMIDEID